MVSIMITCLDPYLPWGSLGYGLTVREPRLSGITWEVSIICFKCMNSWREVFPTVTLEIKPLNYIHIYIYRRNLQVSYLLVNGNPKCKIFRTVNTCKDFYLYSYSGLKPISSLPHWPSWSVMCHPLTHWLQLYGMDIELWTKTTLVYCKTNTFHPCITHKKGKVRLGMETLDMWGVFTAFLFPVFNGHVCHLHSY